MIGAIAETLHAAVHLAAMAKKKTLSLADFERWGRKGGKTRAEKLTEEQLSEIGKKAANARWNKPPEERGEVCEDCGRTIRGNHWYKNGVRVCRGARKAK